MAATAVSFKANQFNLCLLLISIIFSHSQAERDNHHHNSLVVGMIHSRLTLSSSNSKESLILDPFEYVMEPLRGFKDGYLISLNIGTPPQIIQAYMDTGSDLTWFPCTDLFFSFDCIGCSDDYISNSKFLSTTFSSIHSSSSAREICTSSFCSNIHRSDNRYDPCAAAGCPLVSLLKGTCSRMCPYFSYNYGDSQGGLILGTLIRDTLRMRSNGPISVKDVPGFSFGCVNSAYREPIGIIGFGKGALSLPSQLGFLQKGFSHCFLGFKYAKNPNFSSLLVIGKLAVTSRDYLQFTPMLINPMFPNSYYIGLESISISKNITAINKIEVPTILKGFNAQGNGGMLIDSGTTYSHLPEPLYSQFLQELSSVITYQRSTDLEEKTGFDLCYRVPCGNNSYSGDDLPYVSLHFLGDVELQLPRESCFYAVTAPRDSVGVKCLLFQRMDGGDYGPAGVFGSFQQQNVEVVYDLEKERIGFQPMDCASAAAYHGLHN